MNDFFPRMTMRPNKDCDEFHCRDKQKIFCKAEEERKKIESLTKVFKTLKPGFRIRGNSDLIILTLNKKHVNYKYLFTYR